MVGSRPDDDEIRTSVAKVKLADTKPICAHPRLEIVGGGVAGGWPGNQRMTETTSGGVPISQN
jgi:hypothetical protein